MIPSRKLGLYGGSFDPVHHGHLILAREAMESLGLDGVVFVPTGVSPHKLDRPPAPAEVRCRMLAAAIDGEPGFSWDGCEVRRGGPSFAIDTVAEISGRNPGAEIYYFIGEDNVPALHTWKEIERLRKMVTFVVFERGGAPSDHGFPVISRRIDISSTDIRNRIATGKRFSYLLPETACAILSQHGLYRND